MNAMDFDDLLVRAVNVLELFPEVRERYASAFRHVLVDEYQDTNHAQYRWLQLLAGEHRNLAVVGDDDQCLVAGTRVTMADGDPARSRSRRWATRCCRATAAATSAPARVTGTSPRHALERRRDHALGRGRASSQHARAHALRRAIRLGLTPQLHLTYVMWRRGVGFRVGTSRAYTDGQRKRACSALRCGRGHEHADAAWVVSTHGTEAEARAAETLLSLRYRVPTLPFVARPRRRRQRARRRPGR